MWKLVNCYLSGHHEYAIWCEPGAIYLRCLHCGKRSPGWTLDAPGHRLTRPDQEIPEGGFLPVADNPSEFRALR